MGSGAADQLDEPIMPPTPLSQRQEEAVSAVMEARRSRFEDGDRPPDRLVSFASSHTVHGGEHFSFCRHS